MINISIQLYYIIFLMEFNIQSISTITLLRYNVQCYKKTIVVFFLITSFELVFWFNIRCLKNIKINIAARSIFVNTLLIF